MPQLDLNNPAFQWQMVELEKAERHALISTFRKLLSLEWDELYTHPGLNWEAVKDVEGPQGQTLYSLRVTQKMRLLGWRDGDLLRLLSIHPDHDSAYS